MMDDESAYKAALSVSLDRLSDETVRQTAAISVLAVAIQSGKKMQRLVIALIVLVLLGIGSAGIVIVQNNHQAAERSRVATEQRLVQLEILRRLDAQLPAK